MRRNQPQNSQATLAAFALSVTIIGILAYFQVNSNTNNQVWKDFLQGILGNIIATTLSFFIIYIFIMWTKTSLGNDENFFEILHKIAIVKNSVDQQNNELDNQFEILRAIRDESMVADKVQERIKINADLACLRSMLQNAEKDLAAREKELLKRESELEGCKNEMIEKDRKIDGLIKQISSLTRRMNSMETSFNNALVDMGNKLKESHEKALEKLKISVDYKLRTTQESLSSEIKTSMPNLFLASGDIYGSKQPIVLDQAKVTFVSQALTSRVSDQARDISKEIDMVKSISQSSVDESIRKLLKELPGQVR